MFESLVKASLQNYGLPGLYPLVTGLLKFSTKEFLNVLSLVSVLQYLVSHLVSILMDLRCIVSVSRP